MSQPTKSEIPTWLKNLQENSWELELLISGGAIFSLFQFSDFFIDWIQGIRMITHFPGASILMIIGMFGIKVLTLGFTLHLLFRAFWLSLVCINYVYPKGIDVSKLKWKRPYRQGIKGDLDLKEQIVKVDKLCGLVMYMTIVSAFSIVGISLSIIFIVLISSVSDPLSFFLFILWLVYIFDFLSFGSIRRIPYLSYISFPIFTFYDLLTLRAYYQKSLWLFNTNVSKFTFFLGALLFASFSFGLVYSSLYKVQHWPNLFDERDYKWQTATIPSNAHYSYSANELYYMDQWNIEKSNPMGIGSKVVKGNLLEVYVRYDKTYDPLIEATHEEFEKRYFSDIIELQINEVPVHANWSPARKASGDFGITSMLPLNSYDNGAYVLSVTVKEKYRALHEELINRPILLQIPFWIDRSSVVFEEDTTLK